MPSTLADSAIDHLVRGLHADPFAVLGPHEVEQQGRTGLAIRAFRPDAVAITVRGQSDFAVFPMVRLHDEGVFEAFLLATSGLSEESASVSRA